MCLGIFLASADRIPEIAWDPEHRGFNVSPVSDYEAPVRGQFAQPNVYYLGSHTRCGCGFADDSDKTGRRRSLEGLVACVDLARRRAPAALFVCWDGDYDTPPVQRLTLEPPELLLSDEWLAELRFVEVPAAR